MSFSTVSSTSISPSAATEAAATEAAAVVAEAEATAETARGAREMARRAALASAVEADAPFRLHSVKPRLLSHLPTIQILDHYTKVALCAIWKEQVQECIVNDIKTGVTDNWELLEQTPFTEPFWGIVVNM